MLLLFLLLLLRLLWLRRWLRRSLDNDRTQTGHVTEVLLAAAAGTRARHRVKRVLGREQVVQGKEAAAQGRVLGQQRLARAVAGVALRRLWGWWLRGICRRWRLRLLRLLGDEPADGKVVGDGRAEGVDVLRRVLGHLAEDVEVKLRLCQTQVVRRKLGGAVGDKAPEQPRAAEDLEELCAG